MLSEYFLFKKPQLIKHNISFKKKQLIKTKTCNYESFLYSRSYLTNLGTHFTFQFSF